MTATIVFLAALWWSYLGLRQATYNLCKGEDMQWFEMFLVFMAFACWTWLFYLLH